MFSAIALVAQGVISDFVPEFPFQILNAAWAPAVICGITIVERAAARSSVITHLRPWLFYVLVVSSVASILVWLSCWVAPAPYLWAALRSLCTLSALVGAVAIAVGRVRKAGKWFSLGWCGVATIFLLCGGNVWFTVVDPSGAVVANAAIDVTGATLTTDENGSAPIAFSPFCPLTVNTRSAGFLPAIKRDVPLPLLFPKRSFVTLNITGTPETPSGNFFWGLLPVFELAALAVVFFEWSRFRAQVQVRRHRKKPREHSGMCVKLGSHVWIRQSPGRGERGGTNNISSARKATQTPKTAGLALA
jgi:hypothetical protein